MTPLRRISHPQGDIFHGMKASDTGFEGFGEAYFSTVLEGKIKGWKRHNQMTLNLVVATGSIEFVIYDDRDESDTKGQFYSVELGGDNYQRLTVSPGLWVAFRGLGGGTSMLLNIANLEHDPDEANNRELNAFSYKWS